MSLNDDQLIDLGETLLKDYKYSVILYKNSSAIIFNSNYKIKSSNIENIFFVGYNQRMLLYERSVCAP